VVQRHFADQTLKAAASFSGSSALAQVFVDGQHALPRPAEGHRLVRKSVLPRCGFTIVEDLVGRCLPHIDDGQLFQVRRTDLRSGRKRQRRDLWPRRRLST
jgi:hypothetical protein